MENENRYCGNPDCGALLLARLGEKPTDFKRRSHCDFLCAMRARKGNVQANSPSHAAKLERQRFYRKRFSSVRENCAAIVRQRPVLLSDQEQREIDRKADAIFTRYSQTPLTADIARRMGAAI